MTPASEIGKDMLEGGDALLGDALLGAGLPEVVERHLKLASRSYHNDRVAEAHLWRAQALAPAHAAVLIALYRFFFYKNRLEEAFDIAKVCLKKASSDNGLAADWHLVKRTDAAFSDYAAILPRFYLFTLKAYAYLAMRLGYY